LTSHPDKVPATERSTAEIRFKTIQKAYEVLSDDTKRSMYDVGGFDPSDSAGGPGYDEADMEQMMARLFASMNGTPQYAYGGGGFGASMPPGGTTKKRRRGGKGEDDVQEYEMTLEELYVGKVKKLAATKTAVCPHCKGSGGKDKAKKIQCGSCRGQGLSSLSSLTQTQ
jgi:DnaJ homolog subfamily A member 2